MQAKTSRQNHYQRHGRALYTFGSSEFQSYGYEGAPIDLGVAILYTWPPVTGHYQASEDMVNGSIDQPQHDRARCLL